MLEGTGQFLTDDEIVEQSRPFMKALSEMKRRYEEDREPMIKALAAIEAKRSPASIARRAAHVLMQSFSTKF